MAKNNIIGALCLIFIGSVTSLGYFRISEQIGNQDPIVLAGSFNESGINLGSGSSLFSKMFENDSSPADFVKQATSSIFESLTTSSFSISDHPKPDEKTKRAHIKLLLRITHLRIKSARDVLDFLDHPDAKNYANLENPCQGVSEPCPYLELRKKQLGRIHENVQDEIAFIEEILKKKDCKYLRLRLAVLKRDDDSIQAIIKYIEEHNKLTDDHHKDLVELLKHIVNNCLANLLDVKKFLKDLLHNKVDLLNVETADNGSKVCPYLKLQEKLHWRKAVAAADAFGFVFWLAHRHRHSRRDLFKLRRRIRCAIRKIYKNYRRHHGKQQKKLYGRHNMRMFNSPLLASFDSSRMLPLFNKPFHFNDISKTFDEIKSRFDLGSILDRSLLLNNSKVTETA